MAEEIIFEPDSPDFNARAFLYRIHRLGKFVYHGASEVLTVIEPRQATTYSFEEDVMRSDGNPAVCAATIPGPAIFRGLISAEGLGGISGWSISGRRIRYYASSPALWAAHGHDGYVHVMDKVNFRPHSSFEMRSEEAVEPLMVVPVTSEDLPKVKGIPLFGTERFLRQVRQHSTE